MNATFYSTTSPKNKVNKALGTAKKTITGLKPFDSFDLEAPPLVLEWDAAYFGVNYCKLEETVGGVTHTYFYFVHDPILEPGNRAVMPLTLDVLMTYKASILNLDVIVDRGSHISAYNAYMYDGQQKGQVNYKTYSQPFYYLGTKFTFTYPNKVIVAAISGSRF